MRQRVRAHVEVVIVFRFVDAHAPQNDAGMIPVAANHARDVINRNVLPGLIADVLPAGNLFENEQSHLVAGVEKMARLRIVRCAHDVAVQLVAQDVGVATLRATRHRLANERKRLMTVEAAQLDDFAIQLEAVIGEFGVAETDACAGR